jgi:hypothetical protein
MSDETRESELIRLHREQGQTQRDEVFGGLSSAERDAYEKKEDRIHDLGARFAEGGPFQLA